MPPRILAGLLLVVCFQAVSPPVLVGPVANITSSLGMDSLLSITASNGSQLFVVDSTVPGNSLSLGLASSWLQNCQESPPSLATLVQGSGFLPPHLEFGLTIESFGSMSRPSVITSVAVAQVGSQIVAYLAEDDFLLVLDVSNNTLPELARRRLAGDGSNWPLHVLYGAADRVLFASMQRAGCVVLNVSDFTNISVLANLTAVTASASALAVDERTLYVVGIEGIAIYDVSSGFPPLAIFVTTSELDDVQVVDPGHVAVLSVAGTVEYLNVTDPINPHTAVVADRRPQHLFTSMAVGYLPGETASKRCLYAYTSLGNLLVFEVGLLTPVVLLRQVIAGFPFAGARGMTVVGATLYMAEYGRFLAVDVSASSDVRSLGQFFVHAFGQVVVHSGRAFVAGNSTLDVVSVNNYTLRVSNPTSVDPALTILTAFAIDAVGAVSNTTFFASLIGGVPCNTTRMPTMQPTAYALSPTIVPPTSRPACGAQCVQRPNGSYNCTSSGFSDCDCDHSYICDNSYYDYCDPAIAQAYDCSPSGGACPCGNNKAMKCLCSLHCCFMAITDANSPPLSCFKPRAPGTTCSTSAFLGAVLGALGGIVLLCVALWCLRKQQQHNRAKRNQIRLVFAAASGSGAPMHAREVSGEGVAGAPGSVPMAIPVRVPGPNDVVDVVPPMGSAPVAGPGAEGASMSSDYGNIPPSQAPPGSDSKEPEGPPPAYEAFVNREGVICACGALNNPGADVCTNCWSPL